MKRMLLPLSLLGPCQFPSSLETAEPLAAPSVEVDAERELFGPSALAAIEANRGVYLDPSTNCILVDNEKTIHMSCPSNQ